MLHLIVAMVVIGMGILLQLGYGHIPMVGVFSMAMIIAGSLSFFLGVWK